MIFVNTIYIYIYIYIYCKFLLFWLNKKDGEVYAGVEQRALNKIRV